MAFVAQGTKITEVSRDTGPRGKTLEGDGGLGSHAEALGVMKQRTGSSAGAAVGFADTKDVTQAFDRLAEEQEREAAARAAADEEAAGAASKAAALARAKVDEAAEEDLAAQHQAVQGAAAGLDLAKAEQQVDRARQAVDDIGVTTEPPAGADDSAEALADGDPPGRPKSRKTRKEPN